VYVYRLAAVAEDGSESPLSHGARAVVGEFAGVPEIRGCKPAAWMDVRRGLPVCVAVTCGVGVERVELLSRCAGSAAWRRAGMHRGYRSTYEATLPPGGGAGGLIEFYVRATSCSGRSACWPETAAEGRGWTVAVE
jgi:hypothetical protein